MLLIIAAISIVAVVLHCNFRDESWYPWYTAMVTSIVASFIVGAFFQFSIQEDISKEHLDIMKFLHEKNESGLIKYYGSFKDSILDIRSEVRSSKTTKLYVMYGSTILNSISEDLSFALSKKDTAIEVYIMDPENKFISGFADLWKEQKLDEEGIKSKIEDTKILLKSKFEELNKRNALNGSLKLFYIKKNPVSHSYYLFDDKVFFVPSKNVSTKEFVPFTILAQESANPNGIFKKISKELSMMKSDNCFEEIRLDD